MPLETKHNTRTTTQTTYPGKTHSYAASLLIATPLAQGSLHTAAKGLLHLPTHARLNLEVTKNLARHLARALSANQDLQLHTTPSDVAVST